MKFRVCRICDDIMIVAKNRDTLVHMMSVFERFLNKRKLMLCIEKAKIMMLNRRKKENRKFGNGERKRLKRYKNLNIQDLYLIGKRIMWTT